MNSDDFIKKIWWIDSETNILTNFDLNNQNVGLKTKILTLQKKKKQIFWQKID